MSATKFFDVAFAASGTKTPVPDGVQIDGSVSYTSGYGVDYSLDPNVTPSAILVERAKFNQLMYDITSAIAALQVDFPQFVLASQNGGVPVAYNLNAVVRNPADGFLYQSTVAANTATPPAAGWVLFGSLWATTAALNAEISRALAAEALLAPIDSAHLTGVPTAPTAAPNTTGNQLATLNFVGGAVGAETARALAAEALLAPLASPNFSGNPRYNGATLATQPYADNAVAVETNRAENAEALLAPVASPGFTGTPTVPTPAGGDSSARIPNTSWVQGLLADFTPSVPGVYQVGPFIIQWCVGGYDPGDNSEPNYPLAWKVPFPTACLWAGVSCDLAATTGNQDSWYQTAGWNTTSVQIQRQRPASGSYGTPTRACALGIGY